jgi:hypothetical protein
LAGLLARPDPARPGPCNGRAPSGSARPGASLATALVTPPTPPLLMASIQGGAGRRGLLRADGRRGAAPPLPRARTGRARLHLYDTFTPLRHGCERLHLYDTGVNLCDIRHLYVTPVRHGQIVRHQQHQRAGSTSTSISTSTSSAPAPAAPAAPAGACVAVVQGQSGGAVPRCGSGNWRMRQRQAAGDVASALASQQSRSGPAALHPGRGCRPAAPAEPAVAHLARPSPMHTIRAAPCRVPMHAVPAAPCRVPVHAVPAVAWRAQRCRVGQAEPGRAVGASSHRAVPCFAVLTLPPPTHHSHCLEISVSVSSHSLRSSLPSLSSPSASFPSSPIPCFLRFLLPPHLYISTPFSLHLSPSAPLSLCLSPPLSHCSSLPPPLPSLSSMLPPLSPLQPLPFPSNPCPPPLPGGSSPDAGPHPIPHPPVDAALYRGGSRDRDPGGADGLRLPLVRPGERPTGLCTEGAGLGTAACLPPWTGPSQTRLEAHLCSRRPKQDGDSGMGHKQCVARVCAKSLRIALTILQGSVGAVSF